MRYRVTTVQVPQPAAGADWSFVPSTTDRTLLLAVSAKLTTSSVAANRRPSLALKDQSAGIYWSSDAGYPQLASLGVFYSWARGAAGTVDTTIAASERIALPLPWARLQPGDAVQTMTPLIDVGDQWTAIVWRGIVGAWWDHEHEAAELIESLVVASAG